MAATASPLQGAPETQALSRVVRTREDLQQRGAVTMSQALEVGAAVRLADFDEGLEEDGLWLFSGGDPAALAAMLPHKPRHIALLAYPGMFALDFVGPHAVFTSLMHTQVHILGLSRDPVARGRGLSVTPDTLLKDCPRELDVLFVPGGLEGTAAMMQHTALLDFLRQQAKTSRYVTSVCTGSLILGAAGLLAGRKAATYWSAQHILKDLGAQPVDQRVVEDGPFITAGGVTAGLDFGLTLAARLAGPNYAKAVQLYLEYDPAPPFDAGNPAGAAPELTEGLRMMYAGSLDQLQRIAKQSRKG